MTEEEYKETLGSMTFDQLLEAAVALAMDSDRLRAELDEALGVIR